MTADLCSIFFQPYKHNWTIIFFPEHCYPSMKRIHYYNSFSFKKIFLCPFIFESIFKILFNISKQNIQMNSPNINNILLQQNTYYISILSRLLETPSRFCFLNSYNALPFIFKVLYHGINVLRSAHCNVRCFIDFYF